MNVKRSKNQIACNHKPTVSARHSEGRHGEGPLWYRVRRVGVRGYGRVRVRVSDWRTFAMAAPNQSQQITDQTDLIGYSFAN